MRQLLLFFLIAHAIGLHAQSDAVRLADARFLEVGILSGSVVPNVQPFPALSFQSGASVSVGKRHAQAPWSKWFNHPSTGFMLTYQTLGNKHVLGNAVSLMPFGEWYAGNTPRTSWIFKVGLGTTRFSTYYEAENNPDNIVVGSRYTWGFHAYLGRAVGRSPEWDWRVYGGFLHGSNGHVQLPNFGINSAVLTLAGRWQQPVSFPAYDFPRQLAERGGRAFVWSRLGIGVHEYGGTIGPIGGSKKGVYSASLGVGMFWREHLRVRTGFTYQVYSHFEEQIRIHRYPEFIDNPRWKASNIHFFLACEFVMGRIGLDVEGGLNLYKPFFAQWNKDFEGKDGINFTLKKLFPARLGLRAYAIHPAKHPRWNAFAAAHINANFGEADFSALSIGTLRYFVSK